VHFALPVGLLYFRMQATMDQIADSSSSMAPSLSMDAYSRETSSAYSSPVHATAPQPALSQPIGLGIMNCGLDPAFDHTTGYQRPIPYPMSPLNQSPNSLSQTTAFHSSPLHPQDASNKVCFPAYSGFQDWGGSQEMSASPSYGSSLEIQSGQELFHQNPGYWPVTPCSEPTSPPEALSVNASVPTRLQIPGQIQFCTLESSPSVLISDDSHNMTPMENNRKYPLDFQVSSVQAEPYQFVNTSSESRDVALIACPTAKRTSTNRYPCPKCGNTFTRRSNCKQHEKQHDPESRKISRVSCPECSKTFGRKGDLRRHFNNVRRTEPAALTNAYPNSETSSYS
jgi:predicted RNA-binding Zn-ribbon protein involved in translation (DUF1610 family)